MDRGRRTAGATLTSRLTPAVRRQRQERLLPAGLRRPFAGNGRSDSYQPAYAGRSPATAGTSLFNLLKDDHSAGFGVDGCGPGAFVVSCPFIVRCGLRSAHANGEFIAVKFVDAQTPTLRRACDIDVFGELRGIQPESHTQAAEWGSRFAALLGSLVLFGRRAHRLRIFWGCLSFAFR